jgi:hypothetical protein
MAQQPFVAKLSDSVWTVTTDPSRIPPPLLIIGGRVASGATPIAKIVRRDGRILLASQD